MKKIKENSLTNCPLYYQKKSFKYVGLCFNCDKKIDEVQNLKNNARFNPVCVCGCKLELAYKRDENIIFWNCFKYFPYLEKLKGGLN
jgi:hypothetical protein